MPFLMMAESSVSTDGKNTYVGKVLKPILQKVGYYSVRLGGRVHAYVHDLVTESFIGPKTTGFEVNHKDGVKTNNYIINLEYVRHAPKHGSRIRDRSFPYWR